MSCVNEQGFGPLHLLEELATTARMLHEFRSRMLEMCSHTGMTESPFVLLVLPALSLVL